MADRHWRSVLKAVIERFIKQIYAVATSLIYKEQGDTSIAIKLFTTLFEEYDHVPALNEIAKIYKMTGDYEKSTELLNELIAKYNHIPAYIQLSKIYIEGKNLNKALETIQKAMRIKTEDSYLKNTLQLVQSEISSLIDRDVHSESPIQTFIKPNHYKEMTQKILFITANPTDQSRLQTDKEHRVIKAEIGRGTNRSAFEFLQPQLAVTITELLRAMNLKPDIIHFSGHGSKSGIVITNENNQSQLLPIPLLKRLFKSLEGITKLVVLNSCYSSEQAKCISEFGMYVIGNNLSVDDNAAISFAKGLYNGLSEGKSIEEAVNDAMIVLLAEAPLEIDIVEAWKDGKKLNL